MSDEKMRLPKPDWAKYLTNAILHEEQEYERELGLAAGPSVKTKLRTEHYDRVYTLCAQTLIELQSIADSVIDMKIAAAWVSAVPIIIKREEKP